MTNWPAPAISRPVRSTVEVPGSKSITNRALVLAALADGPSRVTGTLRSRDTDLMLDALAALGVGIETDPADPTAVTVTPGPMRAAQVECGLAGTVMRFVPAVAALADGDVHFDGDEQARVRPMSVTLDSLRALGARITGDTLPFTVHGTGGLTGGEVVIDASGSSQFVSGLLLSGARFDNGITIVHRGGSVPSQPHIDMTVEMLAVAGVEVTVTHDADGAPRWRLPAGPIAAVDWAIEPDLSNAAAFLAAAPATGGEIRIPRWPATTTQPGAQIVGLMEQMGATAELVDGLLTVRGPETLKPLQVDLHDVGELTPTVAALCTLADGTSTLSGIAHLRGHETDRLAALTTEINRIGGQCEETEDGLVITGRRGDLRPAVWQSYADHRMATAGALLGLVVPGLQVEDIGTTAKTMPDFPAMWQQMIDASDATS